MSEFDDVIDAALKYGDASSYPALGFNPAPGSRPAVSNLAQNFVTVSKHLGQAHDAMTKAGQSGGFWQGEAAKSFQSDIGELPDYLRKATKSFGDAGSALDGWVTDLESLQRSAADYERQAEQAQRKVNQAEQNPDLGLANREFDTEEALRDAQRRLDAATRQLNEATGDLKAIRDQAKRLCAQHQELAEQVADALNHAKDEAPDEPGLLDRIGNALSGLVQAAEDLAGKVWNFVKEHADLIAEISDVIADVSTVLGVVGVICDCIPVVGDAVGVVLGGISAGLSGVALVGHLTAKAAGADVSWETIALDGVGVATLGIGKAAEAGGKLFKAGSDAVETATKVADGGVAGGLAAGPVAQKYVFGDEDAPNLVDDVKKYWIPNSGSDAKVHVFG